jgi:mannose-1-phosphate guanylyltransferase/mannose-6-phosphate isomerase
LVGHAVILAGGTGTRLWPASTRKHPKQFLRLAEGQSLFAMTLRRAIRLQIEGYICVVTHQDHAEEIMQECIEVLREEDFPQGRVLVLAEPEAKNTAPAIAYACVLLRRAGSPEDTLIVMPADHIIEPLSVFAEDVGRAASLAEKGWLVTFGIPPDRPETGYGYIEAGETLDPGFKVRKFKEKPDEATARSFIALGNHYWNSGMFAFRGDRYLEELQAHKPDLARVILEASIPDVIPPEAKTDAPLLVPADKALEAAYWKSPTISIDYAVMEHSEHSAVVPAGFSWSDVGSWDVVAELFGEDVQEGSRGSTIAVDSNNNFVLSDLPVALAGVEDLIVVVKNGAVLICRKGKSQAVRDIVQFLKKNDRTDLL